MSASKAVAQLVRAYIAALNARDAAAAAACVSEDFVNEHTARLGESLRGREAYRQRLADFLAEFPELRYELETIIVENGEAAVAYRMSGRWCGPDQRYVPGKPFSLRGMFRFEVRNGAISRRVDYWDSAEFMRQVGGDDSA